MTTDELYGHSLHLLKDLIRTPSLSKEEDKTASIIGDYLTFHGVSFERKGNNIIARNAQFDPQKPTILLNSHHDTVKPNEGYTNDPFEPIEKDGKLFGLGSNDAGGCLVSLIGTFIHFYKKELPYNLILAATAEEENSGKDGVESILPDLPIPEFGIVGEPTEMKMGVAEKGLMVLDCYAKGKSGHAARDTGINAIYMAMKDIDWFKNFEFPVISKHLGPVKMTVTQIESGYQHNVVPDVCHFVVDVRSTDKFSNTQILEIVKQHVKCEVKERSTRLNPSSLPEDLLVSKVADLLKIEKFGSPTTSDQAVMNFPTFKMGPGMSERSHTADEFIYLDEIKEGIVGYIKLLDKLFSESSKYQSPITKIREV